MSICPHGLTHGCSICDVPAHLRKIVETTRASDADTTVRLAPAHTPPEVGSRWHIQSRERGHEHIVVLTVETSWVLVESSIGTRRWVARSYFADRGHVLVYPAS